MTCTVVKKSPLPFIHNLFRSKSGVHPGLGSCLPCRNLSLFGIHIERSVLGCQGALVVWETVFHMVISRVYKGRTLVIVLLRVFLAGPTNTIVFDRVNDLLEYPGWPRRHVASSSEHGHSRSSRSAEREFVSTLDS